MIDMFADNQYLIDLTQQKKRNGIFTIGGGVPRNWTQNVMPLIEIMNARTKKLIREGLLKKVKQNPFMYGVRICPDEMDYGHLSGCTYDEGKTWGKMNMNGCFVEIKGDATMSWAFLMKHAMNVQDAA